MNNVTTLPQEPVTLEGLVKRSSFTARFNEVLGQKAPSFLSSLIAVGRSMPDVEPRSVVAAAMTAAVLDLPIDKTLGFAWIVPYREGDRKYAQFQLGYKGLVQLAQRTGYYSRMNARAVNKEAFGGYDDVGEPVILWDKIDEAKEPYGYAFAFKLTNGFSKVCFWTKARVEAHARKYSQSFRSGRNSPWKTNFEEMALKTVIKNELSDWGILSIEFRRGLENDQAIKRDVDATPEFPDNTHELITGGAQGASEILGDVKQPGSDDDGDLGPQKPKETVREGTPTETAKEDSRLALEHFVISNGFTFDAFKRWCLDSALISDIDSVSGFMEIDEKIASRVLRAKTGLLRGLEQFR